MRAVLTKPNALAALSACCVRDEVSTAASEAAFVDHKRLRQVMGLKMVIMMMDLCRLQGRGRWKTF